MDAHRKLLISVDRSNYYMPIVPPSRTLFATAHEGQAVGGPGLFENAFVTAQTLYESGRPSVVRHQPGQSSSPRDPGPRPDPGRRRETVRGPHRHRATPRRPATRHRHPGRPPPPNAAHTAATPAITRRRIKNDRLNAVGFLWVFATLPRPGPPKDHYDCRRVHGDRHAAALRHLFNRVLGQLYHCLQTRQTYDPIKAFGQPTTTTNQAAT
jgi:hypothetical protein